MMARRSGARSSGAVLPTKYQFPRLVDEVHGPWLGVRDGPAQTEGDAQHAQWFQNCYIADPGSGGAVYCRPGFQIVNQFGTQFGTTGNRYPQGIACYNPPGGLDTGKTTMIVFCGGRMYLVIAPGLSGAGLISDITPGNIAISSTAPYIWTVNFAGYLIVSDGVNPPWTWDGTTATYIDWDLSGNPTHTVASGPPTVYYDQLFFVCETGSIGNQSTLIWSEPNTPFTGYVQTVAGFTYADTWTLSQTGSDDITCILGTNTALYYWRQSSMGALYGSPALNFSTTATHDSISSNTGTRAAKCVVATDREIYFLDQIGRPHVLEYGGFLQPIYQDCLNTLVFAASDMWPPNANQQPVATLATFSGSGCYDANTKCIYWSVSLSYTLSVTQLPPQIYVIDTRTKKFYGQWSHTSFISPPIGMFQVTSIPNTNTTQRATPPTLVFHQDLNGNLYMLGALANQLPYGNGIDQVTYQTGGSGVLTNYTIENSVQASQMLYDPWAETIADRVEWVTLPFNFCNVAMDYTTPRSSTFSRAQQSIQPLTATSLRSEVGCGLNTTARAILPRISNAAQVSGGGNPVININALNIVQVKLRGYRVDMNPGAP